MIDVERIYNLVGMPGRIVVVVCISVEYRPSYLRLVDDTAIRHIEAEVPMIEAAHGLDEVGEEFCETLFGKVW